MTILNLIDPFNLYAMRLRYNIIATTKEKKARLPPQNNLFTNIFFYRD